MNIIDIKKKFAEGLFTKAEFINAMSAIHDVLFDYAANLRNTEIAAIEITDDSVVMVSRQTKYHKGGLKFYCDKPDNRTVTLEAFNFGTYEEEDSEMIYKLISPEDVIFDIGANIGWYCNHIAAMQTTGKVYCFEPIPETFEKLSKNVELNGCINIYLNNIAFSEKEQTLSFFYSPNQTGASSSRNITEREDIVQLDCESKTIDGFVKEQGIDKLDFIKCDVEGAEFFVYQGAIHTLKNYKPIVFTEMLRKWGAKFGYHPNDILELFTELDYECFYVEKGKLIKITAVTDETIQTNFFLLHKEKHQHQIVACS